jgi:hypothetical protein
MMATKNTTVLTTSIIATVRDLSPTMPDNIKCREIGRTANNATTPIFCARGFHFSIFRDIRDFIAISRPLLRPRSNQCQSVIDNRAPISITNRTGFVPPAASKRNGSRGLSNDKTKGIWNNAGLRTVPIAEMIEMAEIGLRARSPTTVLIRGWILTTTMLLCRNYKMELFRFALHDH